MKTHNILEIIKSCHMKTKHLKNNLMASNLFMNVTRQHKIFNFDQLTIFTLVKLSSMY